MVTRAIRLTEETLPVITRLEFDGPPSQNELLDTVLLDAEYFFVTDWPASGRRGEPVSWALVPDFMFEARFRFATAPSAKQLTSVIEVDR